MKTKQLFVSLLSLVIILSGVSVASAVGMWSNPTAAPTGNNVDAPINVGTSAQDKAGVLRVTGFRSFFDAIFDTKVQIGNPAAVIPSNLQLLVTNAIGTGYYCDETGTVCFTPNDFNNLVNEVGGLDGTPGIDGTPGNDGMPGNDGTPGNDGNGDDSCSAETSRYVSPWTPLAQHSKVTFNHNLGTTDTVVFLEYKNTGAPVTVAGSGLTMTSGSINQYLYGFVTPWYNKTENQITVYRFGNGEDVYNQVRIVMKKISCF